MLNEVNLIGHLGRDPEVRNLSSGKAVCNLSLATSERWTDKTTGEVKDKTEWHRIVIFNEKLVEVVSRYTKKGSKLFVRGKLQTRKWTDKSGTEKYSTEIVLNGFDGVVKFLDGKGDGTTRQPSGQSEEDIGGSATPNDDIPF